MKSNVLNSVLTGVLAVGLIASVFFCIRVINATRESRRLAIQARQMQFEQAKFQSLVNECAHYGSTNSSIRPILESVGISNAPAAKSATK
jgi:hypothetical protein